MSKKEQELKDLKASLVEFEADNDTEMVAIFKEEIAQLEKEIASENKKPKKAKNKLNTMASEWTEMNGAERLELLTKKVGKESTPASLEKYSKKSYNFLPKNIKSLLSSEKTATPLKKDDNKPFDENADEIKLKKNFVIKRNKNGIEWEVTSNKVGDSFNSYSIKKIGNEYSVSIKHTTIGFKTFDEAVKHLETELYQGILNDYIDESINKANRAKNYKETNFIETTKKDADVMSDKAEEMNAKGKKPTADETKELVTSYKKMAKNIYVIMPKDKFKTFAEKQIQYWKSLINK